jgi:hypothetical protein
MADKRFKCGRGALKGPNFSHIVPPAANWSSQALPADYERVQIDPKTVVIRRKQASK